MAKVESFDEMISSIQEAFLSVNRLAECQHLESLHEFLEDDGSPKTLRIKYPYFNQNGEVEYKFVDIPELCLIPVSTLKLNEVSVDFKVKLSAEINFEQNLNDQTTKDGVADNNNTVTTHPRKSKNKMGYIPGFKQKQDDNYANITLKFNAEEPPEGVLRIRDEMIKIIP